MPTLASLTTEELDIRRPSGEAASPVGLTAWLEKHLCLSKLNRKSQLQSLLAAPTRWRGCPSHEQFRRDKTVPDDSFQRLCLEAARTHRS